MVKRFHDGAYSGIDARREQEHADSNLMPRGGEFANMPSEVIHRTFPNPHNYMPENLDDTIRGIDRQISEDNHEKHKGMRPEKV